MDFGDIFKVIILIAVVVWYIYSNIKKAKTTTPPLGRKSNQPERTERTHQRPAAMTKEQNLDTVLKDLFGFAIPEDKPQVAYKPLKVKEKAKVVYDTPTLYKGKLGKKTSEKKASPKKETIKHSVTYKKSSPYDELKKKSQVTRVKSKTSPLIFSSNPIVQAIIVSEVLGSPISLKEDRF